MIEAWASARRRTDGKTSDWAQDMQPKNLIINRRDVLKLPVDPAVRRVRGVAIPADSPADILIDEINPCKWSELKP